MKKFGKFVVTVFSLGVLCVGSLTVSAKIDVQYQKMFAKQYEENILELFRGGSWEAPVEDPEFTPDEPLGEFQNENPPKGLKEKYESYLEAYDLAGVLDSGVSSEDVEELKLSKSELLDLSDVVFEYYYDYRNDVLLQWYQIYWVDNEITSGYVMWKNNSVVSVVKL